MLFTLFTTLFFLLATLASAAPAPSKIIEYSPAVAEISHPQVNSPASLLGRSVTYAVPAQDLAARSPEHPPADRAAALAAAGVSIPMRRSERFQLRVVRAVASASDERDAST